MYSLAPCTSALMTKTPPLKMMCVPKDTIFLSLKKKSFSWYVQLETAVSKFKLVFEEGSRPCANQKT